MKPADVLRTFAQLSNVAPDRPTDVVSDKRLFVRQRYRALKVFQGEMIPLSAYPVPPVGSRSSGTAGRLLSAAALHKNEQLLRIGWLWFAGTVEQEGKKVRYCVPAMSVPVERAPFWKSLSDLGVQPIGDVEMTELIDDPLKRQLLLEQSEFGGGALVDFFNAEDGEYEGVDPRLIPRLERLNAWAAKIARELDLTISEVYAIHEMSPVDRRSVDGIGLIMGCAMYLDRPAAYGTRRESLLNLAGLPDLDETAFGKLYAPSPIKSPGAGLVHRLRPLSVRQHGVVNELLASDLSVLSGAPGTGKSHVLTVMALDAVAQGKSVLVAAGSAHAVDVLVEHFADSPGPTPVVFGGSRHGKRLGTELATLVSAHTDWTSTRNVADDHQELEASAAWMLELERESIRIGGDPARRIRAVDELNRAGDLYEIETMLDQLERRGLRGWIARKRHLPELQRRLRNEGLRSRLAELQRMKAAHTLTSAGGLSLTETFDAIARTEDQAAEQRGSTITAAWIDAMTASQRKALMQISTAVTSDRGTRRRLLGAIKPEALVEAAPLWVGSVRDVDAVLPAVAGLFDLVILDEAAQIDQMNAANAMVRAKAAIVCGDPAQLGHVSFLSDAEVDEAAAAHNTDAAIVNPRRRSTFDVAASSTPTQLLDEHFRSAPHLIEFSSRKIYENSLHIASRHPKNEAADHIDVRVVDGERGADKVNRIEVAECLRVADELIEAGWDSIGFVSPFRAQADAIEEAILERYRLDEIEHYGLRVGTVHSFQGDERRVVVASWAVGGSEGNGAWRFVNQRNLFNVMVTRAREHMVVVTSKKNPPGLAGEYVRWSEPLTNLIGDDGSADPWVGRVASALQDAGVQVRTGYRVGRHVIDLVAGNGANAIAVDCSPHVNGTAAHIDRALQLRRTGWQTADAFQSRWSDDLGRFAVELADRYSKSVERDRPTPPPKSGPRDSKERWP